MMRNKIFILISGHASLYVENVAAEVTSIQRTLFPGDSINDGPIAFDILPGQKYTLKTESICDFISIDKDKFKQILIEDFSLIKDLKDKMTALKN